MYDDFDLPRRRRPERNLGVRIFFGLVWLVVFFVGTEILISLIVGGIAGAKTRNATDGAIAGEKAVVQFFEQHRAEVLIGQIVCFATLVVAQVLPGTGKYPEPPKSESF